MYVVVGNCFMADHEVDLAELAKRNFEEQNFESCLSTVNKLCDLKKSDPKVLHNRAVAHYYLSNLTLTDDFKKVLYQVEQQMGKCFIHTFYSTVEPR